MKGQLVISQQEVMPPLSARGLAADFIAGAGLAAFVLQGLIGLGALCFLVYALCRLAF